MTAAENDWLNAQLGHAGDDRPTEIVCRPVREAEPFLSEPDANAQPHGR